MIFENPFGTRIQFVNTNETVIKEIAKFILREIPFVGYGKQLYLTKDLRGNRKTLYMACYYHHRVVKQIAEKLLPHVIVKKHDLEKVIEFINNHDYKYHDAPFIPKDELKKLYWKQELSLGDIAKKYNTSKSVIRSMFKRLKIPRRKPVEALKLKFQKNNKFSRDTLYDLYWRQNFSLHKIAKKFNTSEPIILSYFKKFKIPRRSKSKAMRLVWREKQSKASA